MFNHLNQENGLNGQALSPPRSEDFQNIEESYKQHLSSTYESWKALSDKRKQEAWLFECAKAFARKQEKCEEMGRRLDNAEQEIRHLRYQIAQQNQNAPNVPRLGPNTLRLPPGIVNHLPSESGSWDYEGLLAKWKARIQASRNVQYELPSNPAHLNNINGIDNGFSIKQIDNHANGDGMHQPDEDEDLVDAPGDDDDMHLEKGILDPSLRSSDIDGEGTNSRGRLNNPNEYSDPGIEDRGMDLRK